MCLLRPGVVKSISRYFRRFSSVFSTPMSSKRFPQVGFDSSEARMPLPGAAIALAVAISSSSKGFAGSGNLSS